MNIGIIGLGLMGGSLGRALVKMTEHKVFALDTDEEAMCKGALLKAYHERLTHDNAKDVDLLVLALLPSAMPAVLEEMMKEFASRYPDVDFAGGHPMAGREFSGVAHSTAGLYENATVLLVSVSTPLEKLAMLKAIYKQIGAEGVLITTAEEHDRMIAYTSQLAHVVSSAYVKSAAAEKHYGYSAGSFRDMTRVARMNPAMWTELMTDNADCLSGEIRAVAKRLTAYADCLDNKDEKGLFDLLEEGNEIKLSVEKDRLKKLSNALDED